MHNFTDIGPSIRVFLWNGIYSNIPIFVHSVDSLSAITI